MSRLLAYAFPFILIAIEYGLRVALRTDTAGFVGPALASAAAGLLVPLVALKDKAVSLGADVQAELKALKVTVRSHRDELVSALSVLLLLCAVAAWVWSLVLAEGKDPVLIVGFSRPVMIGLVCYFVAIIAAEVKEVA